MWLYSDARTGASGWIGEFFYRTLYGYSCEDSVRKLGQAIVGRDEARNEIIMLARILGIPTEYQHPVRMRRAPREVHEILSDIFYMLERRILEIRDGELCYRGREQCVSMKELMDAVDRYYEHQGNIMGLRRDIEAYCCDMKQPTTVCADEVRAFCEANEGFERSWGSTRRAFATVRELWKLDRPEAPDATMAYVRLRSAWRRLRRCARRLYEVVE